MQGSTRSQRNTQRSVKATHSKGWHEWGLRAVSCNDLSLIVCFSNEISIFNMKCICYSLAPFTVPMRVSSFPIASKPALHGKNTKLHFNISNNLLLPGLLYQIG